MEKLMQLYRDFGLPLPPAEAPLVRVPTGWREVQDDGKTGPLVNLGFLLNSATAEVLCGTWKFHVRQEEQADMKTVTADGLDLTGLSFKFESDPWPSLGPAVAMQCYARGDKELAAKLVAAIVDQAGGAELKMPRPEAPRTMHGDPGTFRGYVGGGPEVHLAAVAWSFWVQELMNPDTDRKRALAALQQVLTVAPGLADTPRQQYLEGLAATLKPSLAEPGSMEAAIDGLVECRGTLEGLRQNEAPDAAYEKVLLMGFAAMPELIKHLDDPRLSRAMRQAIMNSPAKTKTVGDLAVEICENILGQPSDEDRGKLPPLTQKESILKRWSAAEKENEETYLRDHVLPRGKGVRFPNEGQLHIIAVRYPQLLPEIYRTLLEKRPDLQSWPVAERIGKSDLSREEKVHLLEMGANRKELVHRHAALLQLRALDPASTDAILLKTLAQLPKKASAPVWASDEARIIILIGGSESPEVWKATAAAAKRAEISLRLEILNGVCRSGVGPPHVKEKLQLLAQFLDDPAVRVKDDDPKLYSGPSAAMQFPRITVGNFAAMQMAGLLRYGDSPKPDWPPEKWTELKRRVREAAAAP
jgi:hypothetical protein